MCFIWSINHSFFVPRSWTFPTASLQSFPGRWTTRPPRSWTWRPGSRPLEPSENSCPAQTVSITRPEGSKSDSDKQKRWISRCVFVKNKFILYITVQSRSPGLVVEHLLHKKCHSATVDRIPLWALNIVSLDCDISMNKEIIFLLSDIEERLHDHV